MKLTKIVISFIPLFLIALTSFSQEEQEGSLNSGTIESQFEYLYKKSGRYQDYRVIKINELFKFRNNVYDSLKVGQENLRAEKVLVTEQKNRIDSLNVQLASVNGNLDDVTKEKDSIRLLGIQMSKGAYNTILWSIIAALTAALLFFIAKFKNSNAVTIEAKNAKSEIEEEYELHRQRALEREQKLRRELQDELNKQKYAKQDSTKKSGK